MSELISFENIIGSEYLSEIENEQLDYVSSSSEYDEPEWEWDNDQTDTSSGIDSDFEDRMDEHRLNEGLTWQDELRYANANIRDAYWRKQREWDAISMEPERVALLMLAAGRIGQELRDQDDNVIHMAANVVNLLNVSEEDQTEILDYGWTFLPVAMPWWKMEHFYLLRHAFELSTEFGMVVYRKLPGIGKMYYNMDDYVIRSVLMGSKYKRARKLAQAINDMRHNEDHYRVLWRVVCEIDDACYDPFFDELECDVIQGLKKVSAADDAFKELRRVALGYMNLMPGKGASTMITLNDKPCTYGGLSFSDEDEHLAYMLLDGTNQDVTIERWPDQEKGTYWPAYQLPYYDRSTIKRLVSEFRCAGCKHMGKCDMVFGSTCAIQIFESSVWSVGRLHVEKRPYGWVMIFDYKYFSINYVVLFRSRIYISLGCLGMVFNGHLYKIQGTTMSLLTLPTMKSVNDVLGELMIWNFSNSILNDFPSFEAQTRALEDQIKAANELNLPNEIVFMINRYIFSPLDMSLIRADANRAFKAKHETYGCSNTLIF
jgi:hypothetical protein